MLIVGNWKAYVESAAKAKKLIATLKTLALRTEHELVAAPPAPYLGLLAAPKLKIGFAAQDVSVTTGGATTGEVAAGLLADLGVTYVIVGHSERRAQSETDAVVAEKVRHVLAHGMTPIVCVGETERDSDAQYLKQVRTQISAVFSVLSPKERLATVIAYEPVWAIGKSGAEAITAADLSEMVLYIHKVLGDFIPGKANTRVRIIYGGSVEPGNARLLAAGTGVEGFLVGRASTDAALFSALVKAVS